MKHTLLAATLAAISSCGSETRPPAKFHFNDCVTFRREFYSGCVGFLEASAWWAREEKWVYSVRVPNCRGRQFELDVVDEELLEADQ